MVHPGETARLLCLLPKNATIGSVKVVKQGLHGNGYTFFYRGGRLRESFQLQSFKGRVHFCDPRMENGDVSVFLSNVSLNDTGTFEFIVRYMTVGSNDTEVFRHSINVTVKDAHVQDRGHTGLAGSDDLLAVLSVLRPLLLLVPIMTLFTCFILRLVQKLCQCNSADPPSHILIGIDSNRT